MEENLMERLKEALENRPEIQFAYLFGSQARGRAGRLSDLDVAVHVDEKALRREEPYGYQAQLTADLTSALKTNAIDVVILNQAKPFLRFQVIRHGRVILSRRDAERIAFQVRTFNQYQDVKRLMEIQHQALARRITEGKFGRPL